MFFRFLTLYPCRICSLFPLTFVVAPAVHAHDAQEAAKKFVEEGSLNGKIFPNSFTEDTIIAQFTSPECVTTDSTGEYLATRLNEHSSLTLFNQEGFSSVVAANEEMETIPGYHSLLASVAVDYSSSMFINIYETLEGAVSANNAVLEQNAKENYTMGEIYPVTAGQIKFDYLCVAGNAPDDASQTDGPLPPSSAITSSVYAVGAYGAIVALSVAGILLF